MGLAGRIKNGHTLLRKGMSKREVLDILGEPTGSSCRRGVDTLIWKHTEWKGMLRGGSVERSVECDFEDNKLVGWETTNADMSRW